MVQAIGCAGALKALRSSQPLNWLATSSLRAGLNLLSVHPEAVVKHLHRVGPVACRLPNGRTLRFWSRGDDWVSNQVFWRGWHGYEPETVPLFFRLATRANVTIDVGAHVGFYALLAAHANPSGRVVAFEPMPAIHARLARNVRMNGLVNVTCVKSAVGMTEGIADFYHVASDIPCSSSLSLEFMASACDVKRQPVSVVALDRFAEREGLGRVDLVKIDTESTEPQVLQGMVQILGRDRPTLVCEVLRGRGSERSLEEILGPLGYRYYLLTPDGPSPRERIHGHPQWLNYLFTPLGAPEVARL
jgi:FkbM family methyltransferase